MALMSLKRIHETVWILFCHPVAKMRNECLLCQPPNLSSKRDANWQIYETKRRLYFPKEIESMHVCHSPTRSVSNRESQSQWISQWVACILISEFLTPSDTPDSNFITYGTSFVLLGVAQCDKLLTFRTFLN